MLRELLTLLREKRTEKKRLNQLINADIDYKLLQRFVDSTPNNMEVVIRDQNGMTIKIRRIREDENLDNGAYYK